MGCVYILKNEAMPGLIKIGYTKETAEKRANDLYTTGVPQPFEVAYKLDKLEPEQYTKLEDEIHKELAQHRVNPKREFFEYPVDDAIQVLKKLHTSVLKESRRPRWLKWIPGLSGFRSEKKADDGDTDESESDETSIIGGAFMRDGNGNRSGTLLALNGKPYYSSDSGFACAAAGRGVKEAVRAHIDVIVRNDELEIASSHEQIEREIDLLNDNRDKLEESQRNYQKELKDGEQEVATKEVELAELRAKLEAPPEAEVMPTSDPRLDTLRAEKKANEGELARMKVARAGLVVASKAPTTVQLANIPPKPALSPRQLLVAIGATLTFIGLLCYLYVFYSSVAEKAFMPREELSPTGVSEIGNDELSLEVEALNNASGELSDASGERDTEGTLNQFVDSEALYNAWTKKPKNWFVLLFPMIFVAFAYVAHFCLNRVVEANKESIIWLAWLAVVLLITFGLDWIVANNIAENIRDVKVIETGYKSGVLEAVAPEVGAPAANTPEAALEALYQQSSFQQADNTWMDVASVLMLGFTVSLLLSGSLYCTLKEWGDVRPMATQIKAEKNERKIKLTELSTEIEALENDINSLDTQIAAQIKAHRYPLQVEINRIGVEKENKEKEVNALSEVNDHIQSEIEKHQTKINELDESLKRPERKSIDLRKMEAHVNDFVSGWCRFVAQRETVLADDLPTQIEDIRTAAQQTLTEYKSTLDL
ncbi:hypothetical protein C6502_05535 [Candidatus Poribacteria bacterium]|nr:MAG: hypothetical protein C6502_05535 [Candidatus Poribacteria bacterium]